MTGTPILGLFNTTTNAQTALVPLSSFPGMVPSAPYVVRSHATGAVSPPLTAIPASSTFATAMTPQLLRVALPVRGHDVLTAYPTTALHSETFERSVLVANLGLLGKLAGGAAILATAVELRDTGTAVVAARLKALGTVGVYISLLPELVGDGSPDGGISDFMVTVLGQAIPFHTLHVGGTGDGTGRVLEIDLETAWKEMGLSSGWSNEVEVKVYFKIG